MALIKCVNCGKTYTSQLEACPHCNNKPNAYVCPECKNICRRSDSACPNCGMEFNSETFLPASAKYLQDLLDKLEKALSLAKTYEQFNAVYEKLDFLGDYGNANDLRKLCMDRINELKEDYDKKQKYERILELIKNSTSYKVLDDCLNQLDEFKDMDGYSAAHGECYEKWQQATYEEASGETDLTAAKSLYSKLGDYKDAKEKVAAIEEEEKILKAKKAKPIKIAAISAAAIMAVVVLVIFLIIPRSNYNKGIEAYETKDYKHAVEFFQKARSYSDSEKYLLMSYYKYGDVLLDDEQYVEASEQYTSAGTYEDSEKMVNYALGMYALKNENLEDAYSYFNKADGVRETKKMLNACDLLTAEEYYQSGHLGEAKDAFKELPKDFEYNGIRVSKRLNTLKKYNSFVKLCGEWSDSDAYTEVRQTWDYDGRWENWYNNLPATMTVTCKIKKNGKVHIEGNVKFWLYTKYSSLGSIVENNCKEMDFSIDKTVSSLNQTLHIASYTNMTVNGSTVNVKYYQNSPNESAYFTYLYRSNMKFTKDKDY